MELKDSQTKKNLLRSFAGESQARNRYDIAASTAKNEGIYVVEALFKYTANQEKEHAEVFYGQLKQSSGENIEICAGYPVDTYTTTLDLLKVAKHNEFEEFNDVYSEFAKVAKEEGFLAVSKIFENIGSIERIHATRFERFEKELEEGSLFKKEEETQWMCTNCGFIYEGKEAPKDCPACQHPQGYFILFSHSLFE
ncbi:rubrerythrin [Clostridium uliginosum]|uniref:Rubrerythrin n=1 Tax=Clostridium uliginosum TaxID=119641 RepID=A0A1I1PP45_9CLOT|nr:rubrerythrin family protein [Clostridium uliginosum]SFD11664.1 Rubrerythrin [Clostridium uliginosum]